MKNKPPFHFSSVSMSGSVCSLDFQDGITFAPVFRLDAASTFTPSSLHGV
jgi:hypothetical protein